MKATKISLLFSLLSILAFISFISSISYAWVNSDPFSNISQNNLDVSFVNEDGYKDISPIVIENGIYPGWSNTYKLIVKNFGAAADYRLGLDFQYDDIKHTVQLADVIHVCLAEAGHPVKNCSMAKLNDRPLLESTIKANEKHTFSITFKMDENAGNHYQGLNLNFNFVIAAEPASTRVKKGSNAVITIPAPTDIPDPGLQDPAEPLLPDRGEEDSFPEIPDDPIPAAPNLPETGGIPAEYIYSFGVLLICIGFTLKLHFSDH